MDHFEKGPLRRALFFASGTQTDPFSGGDPAFDFVFQVFVNPDNRFTLGNLKARKLGVTVPGPGVISVADGSAAGADSATASARKKLLETSQTTAAGAGPATVAAKLLHLRRHIREGGKVSLSAGSPPIATGG